MLCCILHVLANVVGHLGYCMHTEKLQTMHSTAHCIKVSMSSVVYYLEHTLVDAALLGTQLTFSAFGQKRVCLFMKLCILFMIYFI